MSRVYLDTSGLLPLLDTSNEAHEAVRRVVEGLAEEGAKLVLSSYTLVEAGALIRRRLGMETFRRLGDTIDRIAEIVWVDSSLHQRAWRETAGEARRGPSLVDTVGFLVMEDQGIARALALDRHFRERGFEVLPADVSS